MNVAIVAGRSDLLTDGADVTVYTDIVLAWLGLIPLREQCLYGYIQFT